MKAFKTNRKLVNSRWIIARPNETDSVVDKLAITMDCVTLLCETARCPPLAVMCSIIR